jgi:hypothetical protein
MARRKLRTFREDDRWDRWLALAREEGTTLSAVIRGELTRWERRIMARRRGERSNADAQH